MALIRVDADQLEEHLNNDNIKVTAFEWDQHFRGSPSVQFTVERELEFEDDDLIEKEEYDELNALYTQSQLLLEESEEELKQTKIILKSLQDEYDELDRVYRELKVKKSLWTKLHFWK